MSHPLRGLIKTASFSKLKNFEKCPLSVKLGSIDKLPRPVPKSDAPNVRGDKIHKIAEYWVNGGFEEDKFPKDLRKFEDYFRNLRTMYMDRMVELEEEWGFTYDWEKCGYWDDNVAIRIKCDNVIHHDETSLTVTDYKTGKSMGNEVSHTQQGQFYAIGAFMRYPKVTHVTVDIIYLDEKKRMTKHYTREKALALLVNLQKRIDEMFDTTVFRAKANKYNCQWCDYGPTNGTGACQFGVEM